MNARVVTLGEALGMIRTDGVGSFEIVPTGVTGFGGAEANVAIGLARLGIDVAWLGRIGDDGFGRRIRRELRGEGVETIAIVDSNAPTAIMVKESPRPGRTVVTFHRTDSAGSRLSAADVELLRVEEAGMLHITGIPLAVSPTAAGAVERAVEIAREVGATISFDVNHRASLWKDDDAASDYRRLAARSDIVFGGQDELESLVGPRSTERELAAAVAKLGPREVVVKCGVRGAGAWRDGDWRWCDAIPAKVVDTVGAGDAFVAGYLSIRVAHGDMEYALHRAVRTGSAVCEFPGDWEGAVRLEELAFASDSDPVRR